MSTEMSLRRAVEEAGGALSVPDAAAFLEAPVSMVRRLHAELDGPVAGRTLVVTADFADALEDAIAEIYETVDDEDEDEDEEPEGERVAISFEAAEDDDEEIDLKFPGDDE